MERNNIRFLKAFVILSFCLMITIVFQLFGAVVFPSAFSQSKRILPALKIHSSLKLDGHLNEAVWKNAQFSSDFLQQEPGDGTAPTESTAIGCLYNQHSLYFGIRCFDSDYTQIIRSELRRDAYMDHDDYFEIVLDTYRDNRSGFYFIFNAYGNRRDAKISDEGLAFNPEWDGIWQCKTTINEKGWFAEVTIPWKTLRFVEQDTLYIGANFARMVRRKNEHLIWRHIPRKLGGLSFFRLSQAGVVGPFFRVKMGGNIEMQPFALIGLENDQQTNFHIKNVNEIGLDVKLNLSSNTVADLTLNTDFAQVEADQEQVNLTRFSLYFPEKRPFFLEGAEIFHTGGPNGYLSSQAAPDALILYYSRRIGIEKGHPVPLLGGGKFVGKIHRTTLGLLSMQTKATEFYEDDALTQLPSTNFSVFRLKQDIFNRSSIGLLLTNKFQSANNRSNQMVAADVQIAITPNLSLYSILSGTHTSDSSNYQSKAASVNLNWQSDRFQSTFQISEIEPNFNAEMGFIQRRGIRRTEGSFFYLPRPRNSSRIRKFSYGTGFTRVTNQHEFLFEQEYCASFGISFQSSAWFFIRLTRTYHYLVTDWELKPGTIFKQGSYKGYHLYSRYLTSTSRPVSAILKMVLSNYYDGFQESLSSGISLNRIGRLRLETTFDWNRIKLPADQFKTFIISSRIIYAFSTQLYLKAYLQYNRDPVDFDERSKWSMNLLLRYIYQPGSSFYLVYNQQQFHGSQRNEILNRTLMMKLVYFWRK